MALAADDASCNRFGHAWRRHKKPDGREERTIWREERLRGSIGVNAGEARCGLATPAQAIHKDGVAHGFRARQRERSAAVWVPCQLHIGRAVHIDLRT